MSTEDMAVASDRTQPQQRGLPRPGPHTKLTAWTVAVLLVMFTVIGYADRTVLAVAATPLMHDLHITPTQFGLLGSAFYVLFGISSILVGLLANRISPRWVLATMALVWSLTQVPMVAVAGFGVLLGSRIVLGAAEGPTTGVATHTVFSWFPPERRALPTALVAGGPSIAKFVAAPLLTLVIVSFGWRAGFLALAVAGAVWCVLWLLLGRLGPYAATAPAPDPVAPRPIAAATDAAISTDAAVGRVPLRRVLLNRSFLGGLIGLYASYGLVVVVLLWLPAYLQQGLGYSQLSAGLLYGLPSVASLGCMGVGSWLVDRLLGSGRARRWDRALRGVGPGLATILGGAAFVALSAVGAPALAVALVVAGYGLINFAGPVTYTVIGAIAPPGQRAGVLGTYFAIQSTAGIVAPFVTGVLVTSAANAVDGFTRAFMLWGVLSALGGLAMVLLVDPVRDTYRENP